MLSQLTKKCPDKASQDWPSRADFAKSKKGGLPTWLARLEARRAWLTGGHRSGADDYEGLL